MTVSKPLLTITSLVMAAMFGGGVYIMMNMDVLAKTAIERVGSQALGVDVNVGAVKIEIQEKRASVSNLRIGNPDGFNKPFAVLVDEIGVSLGNISKELVVFEDIAVKGTNVNLEVTEGGTNLQVLRNNIPQKPAEASSPETATEEEETAEPVKVIVKRFEMSSAQLNPSVTLLQEQDLQAVVVPDIVLSDIGERENGVLAREAVVQIWTQVSKRLSATANEAGFYQGLSQDVLDDLVKGQLGEFKEKLQDGLSKVGDRLKDLF